MLGRAPLEPKAHAAAWTLVIEVYGVGRREARMLEVLLAFPGPPPLA